MNIIDALQHGTGNHPIKRAHHKNWIYRYACMHTNKIGFFTDGPNLGYYRMTPSDILSDDWLVLED